MTALLIKESVNQTVDNMGFYNSLQACFTLHQLNHSHWAEVHENKYPVAVPEDGIADWRNAPARCCVSVRPTPSRDLPTKRRDMYIASFAESAPDRPAVVMGERAVGSRTASSTRDPTASLASSGSSGCAGATTTPS